MSEQLLALVLLYGVPALLPVLAGAAVGLPLPATLLLLAAGAFAGGGQLDLAPLLAGSLVAAVAGDTLGYWIGRRGGTEVVARWAARLSISLATVKRAEAFFARWGGLAILLTRFLLTPLGPVINLVAGTGRYPFHAFAVYDVAGEAIWVGSCVGLGYTFSANWDLLASALGNATLALSFLAVSIALLALLVRTLRPSRDRPPGDDLAAFEAELRGGEPGERRID